VFGFPISVKQRNAAEQIFKICCFEVEIICFIEIVFGYGTNLGLTILVNLHYSQMDLLNLVKNATATEITHKYP
jgi:hypothetical protein